MTNTTPIHRAETDTEIAACFRVMAQLRPHLEEETFVASVRRMTEGGYRLCFLTEDGAVRAVAGYRFIEMFATGPILYVDDLVTDAAARSRGHGERVLGWLREEAERHGSRYVELDSGTTRLDAHRFYERCGMEKVAFHFSLPCSGVEQWKSPDLS
jgi:GNAT superfamily N-acetyltransferase